VNSPLAPENFEMFAEPIAGTVEKTIAPNQPGRVKCLGTFWPARFIEPDCQATVEADEPVMVVGRQDITMLVVPVK